MQLKAARQNAIYVALTRWHSASLLKLLYKKNSSGAALGKPDSISTFPLCTSCAHMRRGRSGTRAALLLLWRQSLCHKQGQSFMHSQDHASSNVHLAAPWLRTTGVLLQLTSLVLSWGAAATTASK